MNCQRVLAGLALLFAALSSVHSAEHKTSVSIGGDEFHINGRPTYAGRQWNGQNIQELLFNSRMVQGIFDDLNSNNSP